MSQPGRSNPDQLFMPAGSSTMPGLAFELDPKIGLYRIASGTIGIKCDTIAIYAGLVLQEYPSIAGYQFEVGANDSGGSGYRALVTPNI
jgi:hypothetical protein